VAKTQPFLSLTLLLPAVAAVARTDHIWELRVQVAAAVLVVCVLAHLIVQKVYR
jgi:hypothetical protein